MLVEKKRRFDILNFIVKVSEKCWIVMENAGESTVKSNLCCVRCKKGGKRLNVRVILSCHKTALHGIVTSDEAQFFPPTSFN